MALVIAACTDTGSSKPAVDAPKADATATGNDAPAGTACTGAAFDPCTTNTQCMSMNCKLFNASALQVCTVTCTPGNNATCPKDSTGANATCNNMGICKPAAANNCKR